MSISANQHLLKHGLSASSERYDLLLRSNANAHTLFIVFCLHSREDDKLLTYVVTMYKT